MNWSRYLIADHECRWHCIPMLLLLLALASVTVADEQKQPRLSPEEERAVNEEALRQIHESQKRSEEAIKARIEAEKKAEEELRHKLEAQKYHVDPLLAEAMKERLSDDRDRDKAERLLLKYIKDNLDSPFVPELYFHLAAMYSHNALPPKEAIDRKRAEGYFEQAHRLFADKYSVPNDCAWSFLVMTPDASLAAKRKYYEWVRNSKETDATKVWPYRDLEKCMIYGQAPDLSEAERAEQAQSWQRDSDARIRACERTLLYYADQQALETYLREYADTELGRQAKKRLKEQDDAMNDALMSDLDAFMHGKLSTRPATAESSQSQTKPSTALPSPGSDYAKKKGGNASSTILYSGLIIIVGLGATAMLWSRNRRRSDS